MCSKVKGLIGLRSQLNGLWVISEAWAEALLILQGKEEVV